MQNRIFISRNTENLTEKIQEILAGLDPNDENLIEFERGTYHFYRKGSHLHKIFSSATKSGENHVIFPIRQQSRLTIDGGGSDFVFCDRVQPFLIQNCECVTLKNFQTDYSFLRYAYGTVTDVSEYGFSLSIDRNTFHYYTEGGNLHFVCGEDILSTKMRKISMKRIAPTPSGVRFLYGHDTTATINKAAPSIFAQITQTNGIVSFSFSENSAHVDYAIGDIICLAYDNDREAQTFYVEDSKNVTLNNVTIHRGGGMGFVADLCENITLNGFRIAQREGSREHFTTTADGIFLTNCSGDFILRNALIRDTYDDAMNIHGFYSCIDELLGEEKLRLAYLHPSHYGLIPCKVGDVLRISTADTFEEIGTLTVREVQVNEERTDIRIRYESDVELKRGMLLENTDRMPRALLENNSFIHCPHIRLSAPEATVRNNYFALMYADLYIWDLINFWSESGATRSVRIENNRFAKEAKHNIHIGSDRPDTSNRKHQSVVIRNNCFAHSKERALSITAVEAVLECGNTFEVTEE